MSGDELARIIGNKLITRSSMSETADAILAAGYRKIFDGDCGLSNVKDPSDKEAAEAWMRWANLAMDEEIGAIAAMKQMLTEFGYSKPRTIETVEELDALPAGSVVVAYLTSHHSGGWPLAYQRWDDGDWHRGARAGSTHPDYIIPATVRHEPAP